MHTDPTLELHTDSHTQTHIFDHYERQLLPLGEMFLMGRDMNEFDNEKLVSPDALQRLNSVCSKVLQVSDTDKCIYRHRMNL